MKKLLLTTAFTSLIALSATSFAADTTSGATAPNNTTGAGHTATQMKGHVAGKMIRDQMEADAARLNLTADQKTKIEKLVKESKKDLDEDIRDELDDKQKVEFDKIQAEHKAAWSK
jgi:Spy/CpxP family protein refolding chaperone